MTSTEPVEVIRHKLAHPKGGMNLYDEGGMAVAVFKDMVSKIAKKIAKAQLADILKTTTPAFIHFPRTYLEGACLDLSYS